MKILYAIQGTGNGHISRARDIIPLLQQKGEVDILISGTEADVELGFPVKYTCKGLSFVFGKKGGIDLGSTYKKAKLKRFYNEIKDLSVKDYDLVISDFEPVSSWACRLHHKPCLSLSHQSAVLNKKSPHPGNFDPVGKLIFKNYAPAAIHYGFHFKQYDKKIFTPVIRREIRNAKITDDGHYTVYLPAYSDKKIIKILGEIKNVEFQVFSKHTKKTYRERNVHIVPICNKGFIKSMVSSSGVLCGAGFETPAEALFLRKKLMVIPMKGQYEQQCNAAALKKMDVPVLKKLKLSQLEKIKAWVKNGKIVPVNFPDITQQVVNEIFDKHSLAVDKYFVEPGTVPYSFKKLRNIIIGNILHKTRE
ncbi:MAG: glycosyl transferase [Bacteroidota bacterium]|nr:glycosyl transferase [Bacteroidota bacterium]